MAVNNGFKRSIITVKMFSVCPCWQTGA